MAFTRYGRQLLLTCTFLNATFPSTLYLALTTVVPTSSDDGALLVEPSAAEYDRVLFTGGLEEGTPGELTNSAAHQFPTPVSDWGVLRGWAMCTTATAGLVVVGGPLRQPRRASAGQPLILGVDAIRLTVR
jgi:hypothetical protein